MEFVVILKEHPVLKKHLFYPCGMENATSSRYYDHGHYFTSADIKKPTMDFSPEQKKLIQIAEKYSDTTIAAYFSKKKTTVEFFENLTADFIEQRILPYIERNVGQFLSTLRSTNIRLFDMLDKRGHIYDNERVILQPLPATTVFNFERIADGTKYFLTFEYASQNISLNNTMAEVVCISPCWLLMNQRLFEFPDIDGKKLLPFFTKEYIFVPKRLEADYYQKFVLNSIKNYKVNASGFAIHRLQPTRTARLLLKHNLRSQMCLQLWFDYDSYSYPYGTAAEPVCLMEQTADSFVFRCFDRDAQWEKNCDTLLRDIGLTTTGESLFLPREGIELYNTDEELNEARLTLIELLSAHDDNLRKCGFAIDQSGADKQYSFGAAEVKLKVEIAKHPQNKKKDWFDLEATVRLGGYDIEFKQLKKYILGHKREYTLPDGTTAIIPREWFARYTDLLLTGEEIMGHWGVELQHIALVEAIDDTPVAEQFSYLKQLINNDYSSHPAIQQPANIQANLRPYQQRGFAWMAELGRLNLGGCLADDMGLGKTLQTITLLDYARTQSNPAKNVPSLVVVPVSIAHNWRNEIRKFAPHLSVLVYAGADRHKYLSSIPTTDVVICSYGTLRNDLDELADIAFHYLVLDESQYIKNPHSKTYEAVCSIASERRLALTGTPIENSLTDLWAQLNFLNPGLLGDFNFFKSNYVTPIERHTDEEQTQKLQLIISPFILRRSKEEVASDLPPLTEQTLDCELYEEHAALYETEKSRIRNLLIAEMEGEENVEKKKLGQLVLQSLMQLRQLANHPALVGMSTECPSAKFEEAMLMLENLMAEHHKVLIFSSFVKHLRLFEAELQQRNWPYAMITGETTKREAEVERFNASDGVNIFLISIRAGGVGLNLTEADYVFILDPWWNPAVERQAIARAHRIGQNKPVVAYRFITKNTVEDKIQQLQQHKQNLADTFVNEGQAGTLSISDLRELLD